MCSFPAGEKKKKREQCRACRKWSGAGSLRAGLRGGKARRRAAGGRGVLRLTEGRGGGGGGGGGGWGLWVGTLGLGGLGLGVGVLGV